MLGNALLGAWWLDPAVGLLIAAVAVREGLDAWRGEGCCVSSPLDGAGFAEVLLRRRILRAARRRSLDGRQGCLIGALPCRRPRAAPHEDRRPGTHHSGFRHFPLQLNRLGIALHLRHY